MIKQILSIAKNWQSIGLAIIRIITGVLMFYHGLEVFKTETMNSYLKWGVINALPFPVFMVYLGKSLELISGLFLFLGLFTRISASLMAVNMLFICFYIGDGKFYYEDQHPFLFALLALVFFFSGPGNFSIDKIITKR